MPRKNWNRYFLDLCDTISEQSTCVRRKVGALAVRDKRILSEGFNGAPSGIAHCNEIRGCIRDINNIASGTHAEICYAVHAEMNVITQAARYGTSLEGATLYCNTFPCVICTKLIINTGISKIIIGSNHYPDQLSLDILREIKHRLEIFRLDAEDRLINVIDTMEVN